MFKRIYPRRLNAAKQKMIGPSVKIIGRDRRGLKWTSFCARMHFGYRCNFDKHITSIWVKLLWEYVSIISPIPNIYYVKKLWKMQMLQVIEGACLGNAYSFLIWRYTSRWVTWRPGRYSKLLQCGYQKRGIKPLHTELSLRRFAILW